MFRVHHEMRLQERPGHFITLTYGEKFVKRVVYRDPASGATVNRLSLRFRDVQLFLKRVRKAKFYVKYICVGEYGGQTLRPHYHMLLWTDCPFVKLESFWRLGRIHFGRITMQSAMYCLKYIIQPKQRAQFGVEKTRAQFSKGLGLGYLTSQVYDYHTCDYHNPVVFSYIDGRKVALPRYYKSKIFTRYQMREEVRKGSFRRKREETVMYQRLRKRGIRNIRPYLQALRVDKAGFILESTKFNQTL